MHLTLIKVFYSLKRLTNLTKLIQNYITKLLFKNTLDVNIFFNFRTYSLSFSNIAYKSIGHLLYEVPT